MFLPQPIVLTFLPFEWVLQLSITRPNLSSLILGKSKNQKDLTMLPTLSEKRVMNHRIKEKRKGAYPIIDLLRISDVYLMKGEFIL